MRIVRHKSDSGHVLYRHPYFSSLSSCDDRVICLSERSMAIVLNSLDFADKMRTRVYSSAVGDLYTLTNDEEWSDFQYWVSTVRTELGGYLVCNEFLERIAVALEAQVQATDEQTVNLQDVFEALGLDPTEEQADILEALDYIINFPGLPGVPKLPLGQWIASFMEGRYRSAHLQLLRDISISQRGQTVAQGGIDFASLYDTMGETADSLLVQAGYLGKAYWLWRWKDNDQIPGWLGWITTISGLLLGSIRAAIYDIFNAVSELELSPLIENSPVINVECSTCGDSSGSCGCSTDPTTGIVNGNTPISDITDVPPVEEGDREGDPPEGNSSWEEFDQHKCAWVNFILDNYIQTLRNYASLFGILATLTVALLGALTTIIIPPLGMIIVMAAVSALLAVDYSLLLYFNEIAQALEDDEELRCDLYEATSSDAMVDVLGGRFASIIPGLSGVSEFAEGQLMAACNGMNTNVLWAQSLNHGGNSPAGYEESVCCDEFGGTTYTVQLGDETTEHPAYPNIVIVGADHPAVTTGPDSTIEVIFDEFPVTITSVINDYTPGSGGAVAPFPLYSYWDVPSYAGAPFLQTNARPQDSSPVSGVRAISFISDGTTGPTTYTITYEPEF